LLVLLETKFTFGGLILKIKTERLIIYLLKPSQLDTLVEDINSFEKENNIKYRGEVIEGLFKKFVYDQLETSKKDIDNYCWSSLWLLTQKENNTAVGSISFKGSPNNEGEVEIGYGLGKDFEHKGYMTEGVKAVCDWALKQSNVFQITAETDADNIPSQRILQRCGFEKIKEKDTILWRLTK
jgi:RimJ/RimL family protein N-acetyltransferase